MGGAREVGTWSWPSESWWISCAVVVRKKVRMRRGGPRGGIAV